MNDKQSKKNKLGKPIPDEELDKINGGMKIIIHNNPKIIEELKKIMEIIKKKQQGR